MSTSPYSVEYAVPRGRSAASSGAGLASGERFAEAVLVGESAAMRRLQTQLQRLGPHYRTVLLRGEIGCGKECAARVLHHMSPHADGPFVCFDPGSMSETVMEWTGAGSDLPSAPGDMESLLLAAHRGTLYFDEIAEMPLEMQGQLVQVLRRLERVGSKAGRGRAGPATERLETRIIASTSRDLRQLASVSRFREDLYYRIAMVEIEVPPLRERKEDLAALAEYLMQRYAALAGRQAAPLESETLQRLHGYGWPGNVRELDGVIRRAVLETDEDVLALHGLRIPDQPRDAKDEEMQAITLQEVMERHVLLVLRRCEGNKVKTAEMLGISRSTLYRMLEGGLMSSVKI